MNIGHLSTAYHTNFILMESEYLEKDLKTKINWILFGTGPAMIKAFKNEELDIGYMGLPPAIIGIDKGVLIKCVAGGHVEGTIMIAKKPYKTLVDFNNNMENVLSQFRGKVIGVPSKGSIHDVILNYYLKKYKLLEEVEVKNYRQAEFIAIDMKKGVLEGGVGTPALAVFASTILDSQIIIEPNHLWPNNPSYGIFFHLNIINNQPQLIIKFLEHHKKASYLLRTSQSLAAEKIAKSFEIIDKNYAKSVLKISPKYCASLSDEYINTTMEFVKILHELGYIKKSLTINDIFITNFIQKVHPEEHHYFKLY
ncbi:MAG: ABC transporter substrate-binding protein [Candidatus Hermodarchaeota archaeon]